MHVIKAPNGRSYVNVGYALGRSSLLINGTPVVVSPGDRNWAIVEGDVVSVVALVSGGRTLSHFELVPETAKVARAAGLVESVPPATFWRDEDGDGLWVGENVQFYHPIFTPDPPVESPLEFEVFQAVAEPREIPSWCQVDFPYRLEYAPYLWHAYSCRISPENLWPFARKAVLDVVAKYPDRYIVRDYDSIQTMTVNIKLAVPFSSTINYTVTKGRREKWCTKLEQYRESKLLELVGKYNQASPDAVRLPELRAENFTDLQATIDDYCSQLAASVDIGAWNVCPHCKGSGVLKQS